MVSCNHYFVPEVQLFDELEELPKITFHSIISEVSGMNENVPFELEQLPQGSHRAVSV